MSRGRKRKCQPTIPKHIDQSRLPPGIYWDKSGAGRWFVYEPHPEGGRPIAKTVAGPTARLSELHAIMEQRAGGEIRGTIGYVIDQFNKSTEFAALSPNSRRDYNYCARVAQSYVTKTGSTLDKLYVDRLTLPVLQKLNETIASGKQARLVLTTLSSPRRRRPITSSVICRSLPPYLPAVIELAYLCRMPSHEGKADRRFVIVSESGTPLTKAGLDNAWQDLMHAAMEAKVITPEDRFSLHGLKHRGVTDTKGSKRRKKRASGHRTDAALDIYDHDVPIVAPAGSKCFLGEFLGAGFLSE